MTFDPHPMEVVRPGSHPAQLTTLTRRAELAEQLGVDVFCVMPFTPDFMKFTPERYTREILVERFHVAEVVVGQNFTYGRKAAGDIGTLADDGHRFGFVVDAVTLVGEDEAVTFSSTYVRACVDAGDVRAAADALGRYHRLEGHVVHGFGRGRGLGFPTANIQPPQYAAIPADGIYAAWFQVLSGGGTYGKLVAGEHMPAAVSIGTNPTFSGKERTVEAYVLKGEPDLYGKYVAIDFVEHLRPMLKFESVEELVKAVDSDVARTREILAAE